MQIFVDSIISSLGYILVVDATQGPLLISCTAVFGYPYKRRLLASGCKIRSSDTLELDQIVRPNCGHPS